MRIRTPRLRFPNWVDLMNSEFGRREIRHIKKRKEKGKLELMNGLAFFC